MEEDDLIPETSSKMTYAEYLDAVCPFYIECGISADEFWHGDYTLFPYYVRAYEQRKKRENETMWIMGQYVMSALMATVCNQLQGKGGKQMEYPSMPIALTEEEAEEREQAERKKQEDKFFRAVMMQVGRMNAKYEGANDNDNN